jgi:nicotinamidase-related amidase
MSKMNELNCAQQRQAPIVRPTALTIKRTSLVFVAFIVSAGISSSQTPPPSISAAVHDSKLTLLLHSRVQTFKASPQWDEVIVRKTFASSETAVIICDMWDKHWCKDAEERCGILAKRMAPVLAVLRSRGVTVIHAPSDCMDYYKDSPQRKSMLAIPKFAPPQPLNINDPPLPIDDSDGGCDDAALSGPYKAWTCENLAIPIAENDFISDNGVEVYDLLHQRGIKNLLVMGVHANICVLNRPFAIKQMTRWGIHCILVRDLTDALYNPKRRPYVSHEEGTKLVIEYIEKYWCPSVSSTDLLVQ